MAVGLSRSLAIPQLRVSVYDVTIRNTYRDPESCHRPTCGTTISSNVRDNNITQRAGQQYHSTCGTTISLNVRTISVLEDFFSRLSNDLFHWSTMT